MNKRTLFFIKIYIAHFILERAMLVVYERWAEDGGRLLYWPTSTSFSFWLGCSTVGHWGPKALCLPLALNSASCLQLTQAVCAQVILLFDVHLFLLFFRLFAQVHLLIDGSVEGQYLTNRRGFIIYLLVCYASLSISSFYYLLKSILVLSIFTDKEHILY